MGVGLKHWLLGSEKHDREIGRGTSDHGVQGTTKSMSAVSDDE